MTEEVGWEGDDFRYLHQDILRMTTDNTASTLMVFPMPVPADDSPLWTLPFPQDSSGSILFGVTVLTVWHPVPI